MELRKAIDGYFVVKAGDGFSVTTLEMYKWALNLMLSHLGNRELEDIQEKDMQEFFAWVRKILSPIAETEIRLRYLEEVWRISGQR